VSKRIGDPNEIRALFDWDQFETDTRLLSQIRSRWEVRAPTEIYDHGTALRITGLRGTWNERLFRRLCTRLSRLRSPFNELLDFTIRVDSDEFPHYSGELRSEVLGRAPYRIEARFDGKQTVEINLNGSRSVEHLWNGTADLTCGPVRVRLFGFDLETDAIARIGPRTEVRAWLREWSGISIYRDGFRVWPYGEPHDDWLRLDQRRVNNPVVRLSNNQVVGFVEISRDTNPELVDQTNREGLIHNRALEDLRRLLYFVLQILEAERQSQRHPISRKPLEASKGGNDSSFVYDSLVRLADRTDPDTAGEIRRIANKLSEEAARQNSEQRRLLHGYTELAALGQAAVGLSRSLQPLVGALGSECSNLRSALNIMKKRGFISALRRMESYVGAIADRLTTIAPMEGNALSRRRAMDVSAELDRFRRMTKPSLENSGVRMEIDVPKETVLRVEMKPETFLRLMHILTTNSLEWLSQVTEPEIRVAAVTCGTSCEILFSDNGPGIPRQLAGRVFTPFFSGKERGLGMGLNIALNIVSAHGGSMEVLADRRRRGSTIRITLPRKRSRATLHH
jgi:signal transduction histidine kinase